MPINNSGFKKLIPNLITLIRIILAPIFFFLVLYHFNIASIFIFVLTIITDGFDGYIARKFDVTSPTGAYLDVAADFIWISTGFLAFVLLGVYPAWLLIIIVFMFLQFVISSKFKIPIYDPIGKYYGLFLFITIFISLITSSTIINMLIVVLIVAFTIASITSRYLYFIKHKNLKH